MKLYLVRHGESLQTEEQPLSEVGRRETKQIAHSLKEAHLEIDEMMHSVKLRAKQTAEILAETLAPDLTLIEREGLKPMDPIEPIVDEITSFDRNVMIVGHLPFMERLSSQLVLKEVHTGLIEFRGSTIVCLEGEGRHWIIAWVVSAGLFSKQHA